jgi:alpha-galactosidase
VIAVDQDTAGMQGRLLGDEDRRQVWARRLADGSRAVVLLTGGEASAPLRATWAELGLPPTQRAVVRDLWERQDVGTFTGAYETTVAPHSARLVKIAAR